MPIPQSVILVKCAHQYLVRVFAVIALSSPALAQAVPQCREHKPLTGDIGIGGFQCVAAGCAVNGEYRGRYYHSFSAEPYVWDIEPRGPSAGLLIDGDRIVSIDGMLITTEAGGDRLANLVPGEKVGLRLRRGESVVSVTVQPKLGCNMPYISVTARQGRPPRPPRKGSDDALQ